MCNRRPRERICVESLFESGEVRRESHDCTMTTVQSSREGFVTSDHVSRGSLDSWRRYNFEGLKKAREGFGHIHLTCSFLFCGVRCGGAAGQLAHYRPTRGGERTGPSCVTPSQSPRPQTPKAKHGPKTCPIRTEKRERKSEISPGRPTGRHETNIWFSELDETRLIGDFRGQPKTV